MLVKEALKHATNAIKEISDIPNKEARILLAFFLQKDQIWLITHEEECIEEEGYFELIARRAKSEPIEYITNSVSFYSRDFYVDCSTLIPRPETELLVDLVLDKCRGIKNPTILEIGTGSGVISIILKLLIPEAKITAIDISKKALQVAQINAKKHSVEIEFIQSDLCENLNESEFDILVSNPPYIANDEPLHVALCYEPDLALYGGSVGDEIVLKIIDIYLKKSIKFLACEMGYDQRERITHHLKGSSLKLEFYRDLAGLDRGFLVEML